MSLIKKFFGLISRGESAPHGKEGPIEPVVLPREKHSLSRKNIDQDAQKILNRLIRYGHAAYLVGGSVRDLLADRPAKDFDIATSAHPNEIKKLFRNCRLVGRRFRLAHILFRGRKVIEVSTFRCHAGFSDDQDLLIKSDNTFGTAEEDARRRDFTVNGLFYNIADFTVIDYVTGLKDLEAKTVATIGDPGIRFREDPIRMLRAVRLASRLGFTIEEATGRALEKHRREVWKGAVPRILEEILKMLREGAAADSFRLMRETGLLKIVLPRLASDLRDEDMQEQILRILQTLDAFPRPNEGLSPALLVSTLYFASFDAELRRSPQGTDRVKLAAELIKADMAKLHFPRIQFERAKQILAAQNRLEAVGSKRFRPSQLVLKSYFDDALTLFEITRPRSKDNHAVVTRWRSLRKAALSRKDETPAGEHEEGREERKGSKPRRRRRRRPPGKSADRSRQAPAREQRGNSKPEGP